MATKKEIEHASELGYEQVNIAIPKKEWESLIHGDEVFTEKPKKIWLNKKTGSWFTSFDQMCEVEGDFPD